MTSTNRGPTGADDPTSTDPPAADGCAGHARPRELVISHTSAEGTVLDGTRRSDDLYPLLRSLGWNYRRSVGDYRLQASQDRPVKHGAIARTAAALRERGFTVTLALDATPRPVTEAEAERADRADERADRLTGRAERLRGQARSREAAADQVLSNIPLGQPFLVDHSGYAADRRRRERAWANQDRAVELDREAAATEQAAEVAAAHMRHRHTPETVVNRIAELQAHLRRAARRRAEHAERDRLIAAGVPAGDIGLGQLTAAAAAELAEREAHWEALLEHWTAVRAAQIADGTATNYSRDTLARGDLVFYRGDWYPVLRLNATSVSVPSRVGGDWNDTIRYTHIADVARAEDPRRPDLAVLAYQAARLRRGHGPLHPAWDALRGPDDAPTP